MKHPLNRILNLFQVQYGDKLHIKNGEPGNAVAAVNRGRRVITSNSVKFQVSDHDFTKFSLVPSVTMLLDIPETINGSFYWGKVWVGVKDIVQEPSSPLRHAVELIHVLSQSDSRDIPILLLYTDGGHDHCNTYLSVQFALLCVFLMNDCDMLIALRTRPKGSWRNPPKRIMSILNLALQCVGLEREPMADEFEAAIRSASSIQALREAGKQKPVRAAMAKSIQSVKVKQKRVALFLSLKIPLHKMFTLLTINVDRLF